MYIFKLMKTLRTPIWGRYIYNNKFGRKKYLDFPVSLICSASYNARNQHWLSSLGPRKHLLTELYPSNTEFPDLAAWLCGTRHTNVTLFTVLNSIFRILGYWVLHLFVGVKFLWNKTQILLSGSVVFVFSIWRTRNNEIWTVTPCFTSQGFQSLGTKQVQTVLSIQLFWWQGLM